MVGHLRYYVATTTTSTKALNLGHAYHMLHARERDNQAAPTARPRPRPAFEAGTDGSRLPRQTGQDRGADKGDRPAALAATPESPSSAQSRRSISGRARARISTAWWRRRRPASSTSHARSGACGQRPPRNHPARRTGQGACVPRSVPGTDAGLPARGVTLSHMPPGADPSSWQLPEAFVDVTPFRGGIRQHTAGGPLGIAPSVLWWLADYQAARGPPGAQD